ncbi:MAG: CopG family transcriptional regulator [Candidatus Binataceae bacterium]
MMIAFMRTTLDIEDDVLQTAKELAAQRGTTAGRIISELARSALTPRGRAPRIRNGMPILPLRKGAGLVTLEMVNRLRDED